MTNFLAHVKGTLDIRQLQKSHSVCDNTKIIYLISHFFNKDVLSDYEHMDIEETPFFVTLNIFKSSVSILLLYLLVFWTMKAR